MTTELRDVTHATVQALLEEVVELTMDGWAISKLNPGEALMFYSGFGVTMERSDATVAAFKEKSEAVQGKAKLTVQDRMAKARANIGKGKLDVNTIQ